MHRTDENGVTTNDNGPPLADSQPSCVWQRALTIAESLAPDLWNHSGPSRTLFGGWPKSVQLDAGILIHLQ